MIALQRLIPDDLDFVFALKEQAGWNQTRADLRRFLKLQPDGWFLAEWQDRPAGTVAVFHFESVAWIAMMLVEASLRGRGLGRALMEQALDFADRQGAVTVRLDATPLGQPLYEKLGFTPDYALTRYGGSPSPIAAASEMPELSVEEAAPWDHLATATNRRRMLNLLWEEQPGWGVTRDGQVLGFYAARPGSRAVQIGPCAADAEAGPPLLEDAFLRFANQPVIIDVPEPHVAANEVAKSARLAPQRRLLRMTRGPRIHDRVELLWASSGPEKG